MSQAPSVSPKVLRRVKSHAARVRRGREIVGLLVLRRGEFVRYQPLRNMAQGPFRFQVNGTRIRGYSPGERKVLLHSHPASVPAGGEPSWDDLWGARAEWLGRPYAILHRGGIRFFELALDRSSYRELPDGKRRCPRA